MYTTVLLVPSDEDQNTDVESVVGWWTAPGIANRGTIDRVVKVSHGGPIAGYWVDGYETRDGRSPSGRRQRRVRWNPVREMTADELADVVMPPHHVQAPRRENRPAESSVTLHIRTSESTRASWEAAATDAGSSLSDYVRGAVEFARRQGWPRASA